jgi:predicted regulator of Ras-like GTPase activity (Roadblock/LC7/MglB family)
MVTLPTILHEAIDAIPGALFAGMVGVDGLGIQMVLGDGGDHLDLDLAELELATIAAGATAASDRIGSGRVGALLIEADSAIYVAALVTPGYYAVLGLPTSVDLGMARGAVHALVERIRAEL